MRSVNPGTKLKELVSATELPSSIAITSPDRTRRERALEYILEKRFPSTQTKPASFTFSDANKNQLATFLRDIEEPSLFEQTRYGVLRDIDRAKAAELEPVAKLLPKLPHGTHLLIVGKSLPNVPTFKKLIATHTSHIQFEQLKGAELRRWIEREIKYHSITQIDEQTTELIQTIGHDDPDSISALIAKFALFLGGEPATRHALQALEPGKTIASDFELAEVLLGKNSGHAEALITKLISQGSSPFMLMGLLTKTFSTLLQLRILIDKGASHGDIKSSLGISPWLFSKYLPLAKQRNPAQFSSILKTLLTADYRLKDRSLGPTAILSHVASSISRGATA